jgi:lipopolysaccharide/colanic/teichoic acid biosynthesis glycosyltransferase
VTEASPRISAAVSSVDLRDVPAGDAPDGFDSTTRRNLGALNAASLVWCFGVMPIVYALVAFHGDSRPLMKHEVIEHIAFNCVANAAVMLGANAAPGPLDQKLTGVFSRALAAHGALAFLTLITRHFYSKPMMLVGVVGSVVLGMGVVFIRHRVARLTVGVLGPWHCIFDEARLDCRRLEKSGPDIRRLDLVLITFEGDVPAEWAPVMSRALLAGKRVRHIAEFLEEARGAVTLEHFEVDDLPGRGLGGYGVRKRLLDLACVCALLPIAVPLVLFGALGILGTMGWPVLFFQQRVGLGGRTFRMVKLRTMRSNPEAPDGGPRATVAGDDRITPFGRWLRRFRIDELPQLWNVVTGDMSVIGPRPEWAPLAERFAVQEPAYAFRHLVRPGITGWAQVKAGPAADLAETRVKLGYDLFYVKNVSLGLDMQILIRTVWTLIAGGGVR